MTLVYGVIGFGNISDRHRSNLRLLYPEAEIIGMSASGQDVSERPEHCDQVVSTISELIRLQPEFVIDASPSSKHAEFSLELLKAGIPVLTEKPLSSDMGYLKDFMAEAALSGRASAVGYCLRFMPSAQAMKAFIASAALGQIYNIHIEVGQYLPDWRPGKDYKNTVSARQELGGGALLELSHELDYLFWIFGDFQLEHAWLRSSAELGLNVEDIADLVLVSESGTVCHLHLDFVQKRVSRKCTVIGESGRVEWDLTANSVIWLKRDSEKVIYENDQWTGNNMYIDMIQAFSQFLLSGKRDQNLASIEGSAKIVELICAAKKLT